MRLIKKGKLFKLLAMTITAHANSHCYVIARQKKKLQVKENSFAEAISSVVRIMRRLLSRKNRDRLSL